MHRKKQVYDQQMGTGCWTDSSEVSEGNRQMPEFVGSGNHLLGKGKIMILVYWFTESDTRQVLAFENQDRADAFMNAHPYRKYWYTEVEINPERVKVKPQQWFPQ